MKNIVKIAVVQQLRRYLIKWLIRRFVNRRRFTSAFYERQLRRGAPTSPMRTPATSQLTLVHGDGGETPNRLDGNHLVSISAGSVKAACSSTRTLPIWLRKMWQKSQARLCRSPSVLFTSV